MRSFVISRARRRIGLATVQAMARHRLARVPYIGVPRQAVVARARRQPDAGLYAPAPDHADFYRWQALAPQAAE